MANKYDQIIYYNGNSFDCTTDRFNFMDIINKLIVVDGVSYARCHYISFQYMKESLVTLANKWWSGVISYKDFESDIDTLAKAVLCGQVMDGLTDEDEKALENIYQKVNEYKELVKQRDNLEDFLKNYNLFLYYMNSVDKNLRCGREDWNGSIGRYYDPERWVFAGEDGILTNSNCSFDIGEDPYYCEDDQVYEVNTFYLSSKVDSDKWAILDGLQHVDKINFLMAESDEGAIIFSSNNWFNLRTKDDYVECEYAALF